ncbi:MAG: SEL1-like repeat protein, partial [Candidatus Methanomethylophilaceae archaeon]|nr:SEL1-like repeat protein [Candidatus Methanomethylophilaceae archaeon]
GHARAQCNLGFMYENGQGVQKSIAEARGWYQKASAQDEDPEARDWARDSLKRI